MREQAHPLTSLIGVRHNPSGSCFCNFYQHYNLALQVLQIHVPSAEWFMTDGSELGHSNSRTRRQCGDQDNRGGPTRRCGGAGGAGPGHDLTQVQRSFSRSFWPKRNRKMETQGAGKHCMWGSLLGAAIPAEGSRGGRIVY